MIVFGCYSTGFQLSPTAPTALAAEAVGSVAPFHKAFPRAGLLEREPSDPLASQAQADDSIAHLLPDHLRCGLEQGLVRRAASVRGRFAPSPTGAMHQGNLRTALLSWLEVRLQGGEWLLRIDDLDSPRNRPGAEASILADLQWLGLHWDEPLVRQSERRGLYASVLSALRRGDRLYPCRCSRRMLADLSAPHGAPAVYPGTCRDRDPFWGLADGRWPSWRLRQPKTPLLWQDSLAGVQRCGPEGCGDVVVRRADGFLAYHLVTAIDEIWLGISTVLRGEDLAAATPAQVAVMACLGATPPRYCHVPLWRGADGERLAKRHALSGSPGRQRDPAEAPAVIGALAASVGLVDPGQSLSAIELLQSLDLERLQSCLGRDQNCAAITTTKGGNP